MIIRIRRLQVSLEKVLKLSMDQLTVLGIDKPLASRIETEKSRNIGEAAHMMDYQGLIVPSARWDCNNLMIFMDRIDLNTHIELIDDSEVNWPAWKEFAIAHTY